jgi:ABC-type molybdate transport system ATPase subunit
VLDDPFVTLDDERAERALGLLRDVTSDFQVIYLTTSERYDAIADSVVVLEGPTELTPDLPLDEGTTATSPEMASAR